MVCLTVASTCSCRASVSGGSTALSSCSWIRITSVLFLFVVLLQILQVFLLNRLEDGRDRNSSSKTKTELEMSDVSKKPRKWDFSELKQTAFLDASGEYFVINNLDERMFDISANEFNSDSTGSDRGKR
jgi:hypothetical protein